MEKIDLVGNLNISATRLNIVNSFGPTEKELTRLNFEERPHRRSGPRDSEHMDTDGGIMYILQLLIWLSFQVKLASSIE